jgi:hypothetical protein
VADVTGTVMEAGAAGGTIWHPFVLAVQPLEPATPFARTRYHQVPDVFPVTLKVRFAPVYTVWGLLKEEEVSSCRS